MVALAMNIIFADAFARSDGRTLTTAEIKQAIIQRSIDAYPGNCPCPYNSARNGSRCGKRSAYSRAGGYSVICYPDDVTEEMVQKYRKGAAELD
jgi:hypothetical protein